MYEIHKHIKQGFNQKWHRVWYQNQTNTRVCFLHANLSALFDIQCTFVFHFIFSFRISYSLVSAQTQCVLPCLVRPSNIDIPNCCCGKLLDSCIYWQASAASTTFVKHDVEFAADFYVVIFFFFGFRWLLLIICIRLKIECMTDETEQLKSLKWNPIEWFASNNST